MVKSLIAILSAAGASLHYSNLESQSAFYSVLLPLVAAVSLIALTLWCVLKFHQRGISQRAQRRVGDINFIDGPGGSDGF